MTTPLRPPDRFRVRYPSGRRFRITGRFILTDEPDGHLKPAVLVDGEGVMLLDPRAVVWNGRRALTYNPREFAHLMADYFRTWMQDHPEWPGALFIL